MGITGAPHCALLPVGISDAIDRLIESVGKTT
jgi:hypothetical protein